MLKNLRVKNNNQCRSLASV